MFNPPLKLVVQKILLAQILVLLAQNCLKVFG